jgi:hypothetical protein
LEIVGVHKFSANGYPIKRFDPPDVSILVHSSIDAVAIIRYDQAEHSYNNINKKYTIKTPPEFRYGKLFNDD